MGKKITKGLINKSGVYAIKIDEIIRYIGSSVNLESRKSNHLARLRKGNHNKKLQAYFNEFGENSFKFVVILYCKKSKCFELEERYMEKYKDTIVNNNKIRTKHKKLKRGLKSVKHKEKFKNMFSGKNNPNCKYDMETIIEIKQMINMGLSNVEIGRKFGINANYIQAIRSGKRWSSVQILF